MNILHLYHGSSDIITKPLFGLGKPYNDYGKGFYCTEHIELAKEWACTDGKDGYVNKYELSMDDLKVFRLSDSQYNILHWLALLVTYRKLRLATPMMKKSVEWLKENFLLDITQFDIIVGYRADDSYFSFARAFLNNEISIKQLNYAMRLGKLGEQVVLKSQQSFNKIKYISYETVDSSIYFGKRKKRDEDARTSYYREIEAEDIEGLFIRDIIREGVKADDSRLR